MHRLLFVGIFSLFTFSAQSQSTASTQISTFVVNGTKTGVEKKIWLYLPIGYDRSTKKFPVIYMHDAQNLFDKSTSFAGEWRVDETLDSLRAQVIVVGIEHGNDKRLSELTPFANEKYGGGQADQYLDFIVSELKPHIDSSYRTKKGRRHTMMMGSSIGGLVSYYALLKYPKIFGSGGVLSPSLWFTDDIYKLTQESKKIKSKVYLLAGDSESDEMVGEIDRLYKMLQSKSADIKRVIIKQGKHNEKLWRESFPDAFLWLTKHARK